MLDFPWNDPAGKLVYVDLKRCPQLIAQIEEAATFPELGVFLQALNSARSMVETAKCDGWETTDLIVRKIFIRHRISARVMSMLYFLSHQRVFLILTHEQFARKLVKLVRQSSRLGRRRRSMRPAVLLRARRHSRRLLLTLYISGYGNDDLFARNWRMA